MNRPLTLAALLCLSCLAMKAQLPVKPPQSPVPSKPVTAPPNGALNIARPYEEPEDTAVENKLVLLALSGPDYDLAVRQGRISVLDLKRAKESWLNLLSISTTYNDQSFKQPSSTAGQPTYVYPKYYFGFTIPLGIFFSQGNQVKSAREAVASSKDQQEIAARTIRDNVLAKYKQYQMYSALLLMESELINDVLATSEQAEDNFKKGTITVDLYIGVQRARNDELAKNLNLQLQHDLIRLDLEKMIGVPLSSVIREVPRSIRRGIR
jgi:outer membrane protein TolC